MLGLIADFLYAIAVTVGERLGRNTIRVNVEAVGIRDLAMLWYSSHTFICLELSKFKNPPQVIKFGFNI